jgi:hypothetical protein
MVRSKFSLKQLESNIEKKILNSTTPLNYFINNSINNRPLL